MSQYYTIFLAFIAGVFLSIHGGFNTQLSTLLKSPIQASLIAYIFSALIALVAVFGSMKQTPSLVQLKSIPTYLYFSGAVFSFIGISLYYYTIPKLGISTMVSIGLIGQIVFSLVADHFGWFDLKVSPLNYKRVLGVIAMILGIFLIKNK